MTAAGWAVVGASLLLVVVVIVAWRAQHRDYALCLDLLDALIDEADRLDAASDVRDPWMDEAAILQSWNDAQRQRRQMASLQPALRRYGSVDRRPQIPQPRWTRPVRAIDGDKS